jgi:hypothetical protein
MGIMVEVIGGRVGFLGIIAHIVQAVSGRRKRRAQSLKALADRKFSEIEATHTLFIQLLEKMLEAVTKAGDKLVNSDDIDAIHKTFLDSVQAIQKNRRKGYETRRKNYYESQVYSQAPLQERGLINTLPSDLVNRLRHLMTSYTYYTQSDGKYAHELGRILTGKASSVWLAQNSPPRFSKEEFVLNIEELKVAVNDAMTLTRERWATVAREYYNFNVCLLEHDLL